MKIREYLRPTSLSEAYELLSNEVAVVIGGGAFLNLGDRDIDKAIDIGLLGLDFIEEDDSRFSIGAATTLRDIELNPIAKNNFDGVLSKAAASIMGIQLRNVATIGGTVSGKYGFSDMLTTLLALNANIELYKAGIMSLEDFLNSNISKDIVLKVTIDKKVSKATFEGVRKVSTDFSVLNAAAALVDGKLRLCIGARPGRAKLAKGAMEFVNSIDSTEGASGVAAILAAEELTFGTDIRASEEYRKELCKTLVRHCIMEVLP